MAAMSTILNRREFGSLSAATVVASLLRVRPQHDLHRIVKQFCARDPDPDYDLTAPIVVSSMAYGSDRSALARIATRAPDTDTTARRVPNFALVMDMHWQPERIWRPLPSENLSNAKGICPRCREQGLPKCSRCHGEGCAEPWCNGYGVVADEFCPVCTGKYVGNFPWIQEVYGKKIDVGYHRRVAAIPGIEINIGVRDNDHALLFRSDIGVEGMVMPLS